MLDKECIWVHMQLIEITNVSFIHLSSHGTNNNKTIFRKMQVKVLKRHAQWFYMCINYCEAVVRR